MKIVISPRFNIGEELVIKSQYSWKELESFLITEIKFDNGFQTFLYYDDYGRWFRYEDFGRTIFRNEGHYQEVIHSEMEEFYRHY